MRKHNFVNGSYYHIYCHSVGDLALFKLDADYKRFLNVLFVANGKKDIPRLDRARDLNLVWDIRDGKVDIGESLVDIVCFCLMQNHFHFLLGEKEDGNISLFMHRILVSYAKYLNLKYERRGHVFESTFHSKFLKDNEYLLRASSYIHLNSKDIGSWNKKEHEYTWSTFQDYTGKNRWNKLIKQDIILSQFDNTNQYHNFVEETRNDNIDNNLD